MKPPQIPVARKSRSSGVMVVRSLNANTSPIAKQPIIFTLKVPKGKVERSFVWMNCERAYLNIPPIKLPVPISNKIFISCQFVCSLQYRKEFGDVMNKYI